MKLFKWLGTVAILLAMRASAHAQADLGIDKTVGNPTPVAGGAPFAYTLTVTNHGPNSASTVVVADPLPPGAVFHNVSVVTTAPFTCIGPPAGENGTVVCSSPILQSGHTATITIVAQFARDMVAGVRTNTATVKAFTTDPGPKPNTDSIQQNISVDAPLSISNVATKKIKAGRRVTYLITLTNKGSSTARLAKVSDILPDTESFLSMTGTGALHDTCSYDPVANNVTCDAVDVTPGSHRLTLVVKTSGNTPAGKLENTATVAIGGSGSIAVGAATAETKIIP